ncbi:MAG: poly-beta-1,6-N-acetyl-D-glucosamine N-deacetylase PgaB [Terracidiphilus sp.]|jgi:biofilm PGA synthesis lipoprotein PgaB
MKHLLVVLSILLAGASASAAGDSAKGASTAGASAPGAYADVVVLCYHDVRDDVGASTIQSAYKAEAAGIITPGVKATLDAEQYTTSTRHLAAHFDWLRSHGYHVISLQQLINARTGHGTLPDKAVLLTFDDGLHSVYTVVFPLLKAFKFSAVVAVVGAWTDLPANGKVDNGAHPFVRNDFATWSELREMQDSGLVEIASHTYDQHHGITANPQGNQIPAVAAHAYRPLTRDYETDDEYAERLRADLKHSSDEIHAKLGKTPRAVMWPYGEYTKVSDSIAASVGLPITFTLGVSAHYNTPGMQAIPRILMQSNSTVGDLSWELRHSGSKQIVRAVQVDLDYIYDPDPVQQEHNLSLLLDRIKALGPTQVWLQAFADPDGQDSAGSVYFPNHLLPMRADLFSRVSWQLRTRCGVKVYAWMPVLAWRLPDAKQQARLEIHPKAGIKPENPIRLNPFLPETQTIVGGLYEDMARSARISGILFHDDAILRDTDDLGTGVPAPGPARTQALIAFTNGLKTRAEQWQPTLKTARNLFAEPVLHPVSENWFAQSLTAFLAAYDEVALMAMPNMEHAKNPSDWLAKLAAKVASTPGGLDQTVFELQTVNWNAREHAISTDDVAHQLHLLQVRGVSHLAYYPDDFVKNYPDLKVLRPEFSATDDLPLAPEGSR